MKLGAVLMASGAAARFGANKLFHPVDGIPMIERVFSTIPAALFDQANVVSRYPEILSLAAERGYQAIPNPLAREGQSASIRLGLAPLRDMDGVLFAVCDQPWLTQASVVRLLEAFSAHPDRIYSLGWRDQRGSPVIFPASLFPELLALTGEQQGGVVIRANQHLLQLVSADSPWELYDIDSPRDLANRPDAPSGFPPDG